MAPRRVAGSAYRYIVLNQDDVLLSKDAARTISSLSNDGVFRIVSGDFKRDINTSLDRLRLLPWLFIVYAIWIILIIPSDDPCTDACMRRTICAKIVKSCDFVVFNWLISKKGITFVSRSNRSRTTNTSVKSDDFLWFGLIYPHPKISRVIARTALLSSFWETWNSGIIEIPSGRSSRIWKAIWKLPSLSTKPVT